LDGLAELAARVMTVVETGYEVTLVLAGQLVTEAAQRVMVTTSVAQMVEVTRMSDDVIEGSAPDVLFALPRELLVRTGSAVGARIEELLVADAVRLPKGAAEDEINGGVEETR